jgi:hypothetical protein
MFFKGKKHTKAHFFGALRGCKTLKIRNLCGDIKKKHTKSHFSGK